MGVSTEDGAGVGAAVADRAGVRAGGSNVGVAERLGVRKVTVGKLRARFVEHRLDGLSDEPRPGAAFPWKCVDASL